MLTVQINLSQDKAIVFSVGDEIIARGAVPIG